jgi:hypothetical protein
MNGVRMPSACSVGTPLEYVTSARVPRPSLMPRRKPTVLKLLTRALPPPVGTPGYASGPITATFFSRAGSSGNSPPAIFRSTMLSSALCRASSRPGWL